MNSQQKLYDFEVTPPAGVWNRIAHELDASQIENNISHKLSNLEIEPPAAAWQNIAAQLQEDAEYENLTKKLYASQAEPPAMAWENIYRELDDEKALHIISQKLNALKIQPPATVWSGIENNLSGKQPAKVISLREAKHHGWLKYAAAACIACILGLTAYFVLQPANENMVAGNSNKNNHVIIPPVGKNVRNETAAGNAQSGADVLAAVRTKMGNAYTTTIEKNHELNGRYIMLMTEDGNVVRMSKKLGNMADCISGADHSCDDQISKWQKEMASSPVASSPANLLDILDMAAGEENTKKEGM